MSLENYDFDGFTIALCVDEQGNWLAPIFRKCQTFLRLAIGFQRL